MKSHLELKFKEIFNRTDGTSYFSPGRISLLGEYTDYTGGYVFACGLDFGTYGIIGKRNDKEVHVYSKKYSEEVYTFDIDSFFHDQNHAWTDYIKGVIAGFYQKSYILENGFDLYIFSNMPISTGLAASASLEVLIAMMINDLFDFRLDKTHLAHIAFYAEKAYVGTKNNIANHFSIIQSEKGYGILFNSISTTFDLIPFDLKDYQMLVINSNQESDDLTEAYKERFVECEVGLNILKPLYQINHLCDIQTRELNNVEKLVSPQVFKRIKYLVMEKERTLLASKYLKEGLVESFGHLFYDSYESVKNDFEFILEANDYLIQLSKKYGAIGAKTLCSGSKGVVVALVHEKLVKKFMTSIEEDYQKEVGSKPTFYKISAGEGTHKI